MIETVKLRHLKTIISEKTDYASLMIDLFNYKNTWFNKIWSFKSKFKKCYSLIEEVKEVDPKKIVYDSKCTVRKQESIDDISFMAMMEIRAIKDSQEDLDPVDIMSKTIAIACFKSNVKGDYDSNSLKYERFEKKILEQPALEMIGLFNQIEKELIESTIAWERLFMSVQVEDKDYEQAGGSRMNVFNVNRTLKKVIEDYNCSLDEAGQMSYSLTQINSYESATQNYIQDEIRKIKERRMRNK